MDYQIHRVKSSQWKTVLFKKGIAFLSKKNIESFEEFENEIENPDAVGKIEAFPLSNIVELVFNDQSKMVSFEYQDRKDKTRKIKLNLGNKVLAKDFGENFGNELNLEKSLSKGKNWRKIFGTVCFLIICILASILTYKFQGPAFDSLIFKSLVGFVLLYGTYSLVDSFTSPANITTFSKTSGELILEENPLKLKLPLLGRS